MTIPAVLPLSQNDEPAVAERPAGLRCARGPLPLRGVDVHAKIVGLSAEVLVTQRFGNDFGEAIEATYTFPLPDRAALTECRVSLGGRRLRGVLRERGEARAGYAGALRAGKAAALAEEERPDVFTTTLGNLGPGEQAEVRLALVMPLDARDGEATFRFPLVVAERFVPGAPTGLEPAGAGVAADTDRVADASRVSPPRLAPGAPNPVRLSFTIDLEAPGALGELRASPPEFAVEERPGGYRLTLAPGARLDRDVVLRFRERRPGLPARLLVQRDREGGGATFALTIDPDPAGGPAPPRDVVFVLDRSGSMEGWKMTAARRAVANMVDALGERDRFAVVAFDDEIESPHLGPNGLALAPAAFRQRSAALAFLERLGARGGTEMGAPLLGAAHLLAADASRARAVVLVTDGQVSQEDEIVAALGRAAGRVPVSAVGIDRAVNAGFLQRLAALTGGFCELVESEARLEEVLETLHARLSAPALTDLDLEFDGAALDPESLTPRRLGAVFAGVPLRVHGRFRRAGDAASVRVRARDAGGAVWSTSAPAAFTESRALHPLWARARLRDLEDRYLVDAHLRDELERAIVATSLGAGVLSRFTAFLVIDEEGPRRPGPPPRAVAQPVETPAGWPGAAPPAAANAPADLACFDLEKLSPGHDVRELASLPAYFELDDDVPTVVLASRLPGDEPAAPPLAMPGAAAPGAFGKGSPPAPGRGSSPPGGARRQRPRDRTSVTRAGTIKGTLTYLAPEQVRGVAADARADVYALGLLLYEMIGGKNPFRRASDLEALDAILHQPPPPPAGASAELAALVMRALERDPEARLASAAEFGAALAALAAAPGMAAAPGDFAALFVGLGLGEDSNPVQAPHGASADALPDPAQLVADLGEGGTARGWLARGRDRACALRVLHAPMAGDDELRDLFLDEASLEHPNVVRVFEAGSTSDGLAYVASEYAAGVTLGALLRALRRRGRALGASPLALAIARQVAEALAFAHALRGASGAPLGWYHGGLLPSHVFVGFDGVVKIKGFGPAPSPEFCAPRRLTPLSLLPPPAVAAVSRPPSGPRVPASDPRPVPAPSEPKVVLNVPPPGAASPDPAPVALEPQASAPKPEGFLRSIGRKFWRTRSP